jgi:hypothetical protein
MRCRESGRGQLAQEEGEVPGKAGPAGMHFGAGVMKGRRGQLETASFQWRVALAVVGGLGGAWYSDKGGGEEGVVTGGAVGVGE